MTAISFQPTEADLIAAYRLHYLDSIKRRRVWTRILLAAALCSLISACAFGTNVGVLLAAILGATYWFAFLGPVLLINFLLLPRRVRRIFAQQKSLHGEALVEWSDDDISFRSPRGHSTFRWSDFVRLLEDRNIIVLMQSDALFNFIPKAALSLEQASSIVARKK